MLDSLVFCEVCPLEGRMVGGYGAQHPEYMFIGEAPGYEEDRLGLPFVGKAGQFLELLLQESGIDLGSIYITNVVKCRPPGNRKPSRKEIDCCKHLLYQEIEECNPTFIVTLGATPLKLLAPDISIKQSHGTLFKVQLDKERLLIPMYHPAATFYAAGLKPIMYGDFKRMATLKPQCEERGVKYELHSMDVSLNRYKGRALVVDTETRDGRLESFAIGADGYYEQSDPTPNGTLKIKLPQTHYVLHNAKYDFHVLTRAGVDVKPMLCSFDDTMLLASAVGYQQVGLKFLARHLLGMDMQEWKQVQTDPEALRAYNCRDVHATERLLDYLHDNHEIPWYYNDIDIPLCRILYKMEERGVMIDRKLALQVQAEMERKIAAISLPLNPWSVLQVRSYIYNYLGVPLTKRTKKSRMPSVEADVLRDIDNPVVKDILEYRRWTKALSTYVEDFIDGADEDDRLHPDFIQVRQPRVDNPERDEGTRTYRLACARPNMQNITIKEEKGGIMRKIIIARPGYSLVVPDYSQIELRVCAALSGERVMVRAFTKPLPDGAQRNFHDETALALGCDKKDAKVVNYGIIYGASEYLLSELLNVSLEQGREILRLYFKKFPDLARWIRGQKEKAVATKQVSNYFGRVQKLDDLYSDDPKVRAHALRLAVCMPIQSTAADIVKMGMIAVQDEPMILQVHDEVLFEVPEKDAIEYAHWVKEKMSAVYRIGDITFPVAVGAGKNWHDLVEI